MKKWAILLALVAVMGASVAGPALAEAGTRLKDKKSVIWLGSLSTGYVVGQTITDTMFMRLEYMKVPIRHMRIVDGNTGKILWEGRPYVGQLLKFHPNTHAKFIVYSDPPNLWPDTMQRPAVVEPKLERPVLDAVQFKIINH